MYQTDPQADPQVDTKAPTDFWARLIAYIRSRRTDHWIMFAAGLIIGAIFG